MKKLTLVTRAIEELEKQKAACVLCPRECRVDRVETLGFCKTSWHPKIAGYEPHFGEETCLVGKNGSGAVFFSGCNLACVFCQTYEISQEGLGQEISYEELAQIFLELASQGCVNINLVTPSHQVLQILKAFKIALEKGLNLPLVYNTGSYDKVSTLELLEGIVDIYLADFKLWSPELCARYLGAKDYALVAQEAIKEMYRQVGDLVLDENGVAKKGLIIRHLVMPGMLEETEKILFFIKNELSENVHLNLMGHYHPAGKAENFSEINRLLTRDEFSKALALARDMGFKNLDKTHLHLLSLLLTE